MLLVLDFKPPIHPPSSRCSWSYSIKWMEWMAFHLNLFELHNLHSKWRVGFSFSFFLFFSFFFKKSTPLSFAGISWISLEFWMGKLLWNELVVYEMVIAGRHSWQEWMSIPGVSDWQASYVWARKWWISCGIKTCRWQLPFPKWMHHSTKLKVTSDSSKWFMQYKALDGLFLPWETFTKIFSFEEFRGVPY